jgi:CRP-like cAMP-binding protein
MLATQAAIMSIVGVEQRLHALLWALAERWGHVGEQGVELTLKVHQQVLAEMVGARRPTVSIALGSLSDQGLLSSPAAGRWILEGEPPEIERTG